MIYKINFQKKLKIMRTQKNFSLTINGQQEAESEDKRSWSGEREDDIEWGWSAIMR